MYKFLIFDADHTLFDFDRAEENALKRVIEGTGNEFSDEILAKYKDINHVLWSEYEKGNVTQEDIKFRRFEKLFEESGIKADYSKAAEDYLVFLSKGTNLIEGAKSLIDDLGNDYILGMLTNGISKVQHPRLKASLLCNSFDAVAVSGDYGISKPNPALFQILCEKAGFFNKREMLVIGDSLSSDIRGGINFGIDTCWYNPGGKQNQSGITPTYEINRLSDIYSVLTPEV